MAASPCGGRRPPCRWQSDAGNPSRHRPGEGRPGTSARRPAPGGGTLCPSPASPVSSRAPGRPAASEVAAEGRQSRTARGPSSRHPRPAALSRRHALARGWAPGVTAWPGGWRGVGRPDCSPGPGRRRAGPLASARLRSRLWQRGGRRFLSQHLISGARRLSASAVSTRGLDVRLVWF